MVLISGYYGCRNNGDEAVLAALCEELTALGIMREQITVLSGDPDQTGQAHGVKAIGRFNLPAILLAMKNNKIFISGGGSLLQDSTSWRSLPYYLGLIEIALLFKLKVIVYGQGIGPVNRSLYHQWIRRAFQRVDELSVRDENSANLLVDWGIDTNKIVVASDPVFNLFNGDSTSKLAGVSLNIRPYAGWKDDLFQWSKLTCTWLEQLNRPVYFVAIGPGDLLIGQELQREVPQMHVVPTHNWQEAFKYMSRTELSISMRLHGLIFAAIGGSLAVGIDYDPKVSAIGKQLGAKVWPLKPEANLTDDLKDLLHNKVSYTQQLAVGIQHLKQLNGQYRKLIRRQL